MSTDNNTKILILKKNIFPEIQLCLAKNVNLIIFFRKERVFVNHITSFFESTKITSSNRKFY